MAIELKETVTIQDIWNALVSGRQAFGTWAELLLNDLRPVGAISEVEVTDTGTHIDPLSALEVSNHGIFRKTISGWARMANVDEVYPLVTAIKDELEILQDDVELKAGEVETNLDLTETARDLAITAAIAAQAAANYKPDDATAMTDLANGDYYFTENLDGNLELKRKVAGAPVSQGFIFASAQFIADSVVAIASSAATVGKELGNPNIRGALGGQLAGGVPYMASAYYSVSRKGMVSAQFYSQQRAAMALTVDLLGHSQPQGSGVVSAGSTVNSRSGIAGSPGRHLEFLLQQYNPAARVINRGISAQKSHEIASRMGAIPINITLAAGTTLGAAAVVSCKATPGAGGPSAQRNTAADTYDGYIGNQLVRITNIDQTQPTYRYTIQQIGGVGDITILPNTPMWLVPDPLDYAIKVLWMTENDADTELQLSLDMIAACVDKLPRDERRFVILGDWPFVGSNPSREFGTSWHNNMLAKHVQLQNRYGGKFFDVYKFLRGDYPYDGTIYPSIWDLTGELKTQGSNDWLAPGDWITRGILPRRWVSIHKGGVDTSHMHEDTNYWVMYALIEFFFKPNGWLL